MYKILIVEDDPTIARVVEEQLRRWGYETEMVADFREVLSTFVSSDPQLVLLDIALPFFSGYYWCGEIRKLSKVPILFLSSASENMNIVMAMQMGGDDFVSKPFDLQVLMAKIQALLRRTYEFTGAAPLVERNGAILNLGEASVTYQGGKVELTKNELRIMQVLMENAGNVVDRETLMTRLWETDSYIDDNTLTVNITRLRKKLEGIGLTGFIATMKGIGYRVI